MTSLVYQLRASIPASAIAQGVAPEYLAIWSVVETHTETEWNDDGTQNIVNTEREICAGVLADVAFLKMLDALKTLVTLPQALKEAA